MRKNNQLVEFNGYEHNGNFWKSILLCIRGIFSFLAFAALWAGIIMFELERDGWALAGGVAIFTAVFIFNLVIPMIKFLRR